MMCCEYKNLLGLILRMYFNFFNKFCLLGQYSWRISLRVSNDQTIMLLGVHSPEAILVIIWTNLNPSTRCADTPSLIDITSLNNLYNINQIWAQTESWTLPRWRAEDWFRQQQQRLCFERAILKNIWARVRKIFLDRLQEWRELTVAYIYLMVGVIMGQEVCVTICENIYT